MLWKWWLILRKIYGLGNPKLLRSWRVIEQGPGEAFVFFDPSNERVFVFPLTSREKASMIGKCGSVSASNENENGVQGSFHYGW